jgi:hypothetical protein
MQMGTTFTAGHNGLLSRVDLKLSKSNGATGDFQVAIRALDSNGKPGANASDVLYEGTYNLTTFNNSSNAFTFTADLSSAGILMNEGDKLAIAVRRTVGDQTLFWWFGPPDYAGGAFYTRTGLTQPWSSPSLYDGAFRTWMDSDILTATRTIAPAVDGMAEASSGTFNLSSTDTGILVDRSAFFGTDRRGIFEFPLNLPANAKITSASLSLTSALAVVDSDGAPMVKFHGYAGDGSVTTTDATVAANPIGMLGPVTDPGPATIPLDVSYIQSLIGQTNYLGLLALAENEDHGVQFWSSEFPGASSRPHLNVAYSIPAPNTGDYNQNGVVDASDYVLWRKTSGQTVVSGQSADGTGDGHIDQSDFNYWRSRFGNPGSSGFSSAFADLTSSSAVPEPCAFGLALVAAIAWLATRVTRRQ